MSCVNLDAGATRSGYITPNMRDEEYAADFCLVSRRNLTENEYRLFRFHFLLGADWRLCARRLNMDRGTFFHNVYRIQSRLGRVFRELRPYALFPPESYFSGERRKVKAFLPDPTTPEPPPVSTRKVRPIRPVRPFFRPDELAKIA